MLRSQKVYEEFHDCWYSSASHHNTVLPFHFQLRSSSSTFYNLTHLLTQRLTHSQSFNTFNYLLRLRFMNVSLDFIYIFGISQMYIRQILCLSQISQVYFRYISVISLVYLRHIANKYFTYLEHISSISRVYHSYISGISQIYIWYISNMPQVYLRYITGISRAYLRHFTRITWPYIRHSPVYLSHILSI